MAKLTLITPPIVAGGIQSSTTSQPRDGPDIRPRTAMSQTVSSIWNQTILKITPPSLLPSSSSPTASPTSPSSSLTRPSSPFLFAPLSIFNKHFRQREPAGSLPLVRDFKQSPSKLTPVVPDSALPEVSATPSSSAAPTIVVHESDNAATTDDPKYFNHLHAVTATDNKDYSCCCPCGDGDGGDDNANKGHEIETEPVIAPTDTTNTNTMDFVNNQCTVSTRCYKSTSIASPDTVSNPTFSPTAYNTRSSQFMPVSPLAPSLSQSNSNHSSRVSALSRMSSSARQPSPARQLTNKSTHSCKSVTATVLPSIGSAAAAAAALPRSTTMSSIYWPNDELRQRYGGDDNGLEVVPGQPHLPGHDGPGDSDGGYISSGSTSSTHALHEAAAATAAAATTNLARGSGAGTHTSRPHAELAATPVLAKSRVVEPLWSGMFQRTPTGALEKLPHQPRQVCGFRVSTFVLLVLLLMVLVAAATGLGVGIPMAAKNARKQALAETHASATATVTVTASSTLPTSQSDPPAIAALDCPALAGAPHTVTLAGAASWTFAAECGVDYLDPGVDLASVMVFSLDDCLRACASVNQYRANGAAESTSRGITGKPVAADPPLAQRSRRRRSAPAPPTPGCVAVHFSAHVGEPERLYGTCVLKKWVGVRVRDSDDATRATHVAALLME